jgi:hypothetical protein
LLTGSKSKFRALVTDAKSRARQDERLGGRQARQRDRPGISRRLHDQRACPPLFPNFSIPGSRQRKATSIGGLTISLVHIATLVAGRVSCPRQKPSPIFSTGRRLFVIRSRCRTSAEVGWSGQC